MMTRTTKYCVLIILMAATLSACSYYENRELKRMEESVRQHFRNNDEENRIRTEFLELKALSYEKIEKSKRNSPDNVYLCKVYVNGTWTELRGGKRVYNFTDTLGFFFNSNKVLIELDGRASKPAKK